MNKFGVIFNSIIMERVYKIHNSTVKILFGNILISKAEIIVSSDDCYLSMGGGLSKCILNAAGESLLQDAKKKIPAALGDLVITTAGNLQQKFIFHVITIDDQYALNLSDRNKEQNAEVHQFIIKHSIKECFRLMSIQNLRSIAFPAIGAGVARIPYEKVALLMSEAISDFLNSTNKRYEVEIYLYDRFQKMEPLDFLPFFEYFACASKLSQSSISEQDAPSPSHDYSNVEINDNANKQDMDHQIFISYSRKDSEVIKPICAVLNELNVRYWIDIEGVYSGKNFKDVICNAIKKAKLVIFISSVNSNASENVAKEIGLADEYGKTIVPVRIDKSPYSPRIDYDLSCIDSIDFSGEDDYVLDKLRKTIQARLVMAQP